VSVKMRGDWIAAVDATTGEGDPRFLVLHFTQRSIRYVRSNGKEKE